MATHDFVEIRLVCKNDYFDPKLKRKLSEIRNKLRQILHIGRRKFSLKKIQPWNSVKVTFDIPKEAADLLCSLAVEGNIHLNELGILSVEIVGQSNMIVVKNKTSSTTMNSKEVLMLPSPISNPIKNNPSETEPTERHSKRANIRNHIIHRQGQSSDLTYSTTLPVWH